MVQDRATLTMAEWPTNSSGLSNGAVLNDAEQPLTQISM